LAAALPLEAFGAGAALLPSSESLPKRSSSSLPSLLSPVPVLEDAPLELKRLPPPLVVVLVVCDAEDSLSLSNKSPSLSEPPPNKSSDFFVPVPDVPVPVLDVPLVRLLIEVSVSVSLSSEPLLVPDVPVRSEIAESIVDE